MSSPLFAVSIRRERAFDRAERIRSRPITFGAHSARGIRSSAIRPEYRTNRSASFNSAYTSSTGANGGLSAESPAHERFRRAAAHQRIGVLQRTSRRPPAPRRSCAQAGDVDRRGADHHVLVGEQRLQQRRARAGAP